MTSSLNMSHKPWFTTNILEANRTRRKLERKWRASKSEDDHRLYTEQCLVVNDMVKNAKEYYFPSVIKCNKGNQQTLFRIGKLGKSTFKKVPKMAKFRQKVKGLLSAFGWWCASNMGLLEEHWELKKKQVLIS